MLNSPAKTKAEAKQASELRATNQVAASLEQVLGSQEEGRGAGERNDPLQQILKSINLKEPPLKKDGKKPIDAKDSEANSKSNSQARIMVNQSATHSHTKSFNNAKSKALPANAELLPHNPKVLINISVEHPQPNKH